MDTKWLCNIHFYQIMMGVSLYNIAAAACLGLPLVNYIQSKLLELMHLTSSMTICICDKCT